MTHSFPPSSGVQWFITIFSYNFPFEIVVRVWDCFLVEGWKVVFRCGLAMLDMVEGESN